MKRQPNIADWSPLGNSANSAYYAVEPGIIACVPVDMSTDDQDTARQNARFQEDHWVRSGRRGSCVVFFDFLADQTAEARSVYATFPFHSQNGTALVGGTALSRAIASFFTGLSRPKTPTKFFGSEQEALVWCRQLNQGAG